MRELSFEEIGLVTGGSDVVRAGSAMATTMALVGFAAGAVALMPAAAAVAAGGAIITAGISL